MRYGFSPLSLLLVRYWWFNSDELKYIWTKWLLTSKILLTNYSELRVILQTWYCNTGYLCYSHILYEYIYEHILSQAPVIEAELKILQFKQSKNKVNVTEHVCTIVQVFYHKKNILNQNRKLRYEWARESPYICLVWSALPVSVCQHTHTHTYWASRPARSLRWDSKSSSK